jgi:hypothetical protein
MERPTVLLGWALALQLALAAALSFGGSGNGAYKAKEPLLAFNAAAIDGIDIDETGGSSVSLTKSGDQWNVPAFAGFPADNARVRILLAKLEDLKRGWPVATSSEAAKRFKVTEDSHERKITLKSGGKPVAELLVGSSPSFRQAYARSSDDSGVYTIAFATYDAGDRPEDWMDRDALSLPEDKIASISVGDVTLERKDGKYLLSKLAEGETPKESEISKLVSATLHPVFDAIEGKGPEALAKANDPSIQVAVKLTDGSSVQSFYKKEAAGGAYVFSRSGKDYLFRVAETNIEPIVKAKHEALVDAKGAQAETKPQDQRSGG